MSKEYGILKIIVYGVILGVFIVMNMTELTMISIILFWVVVELIIMNERITD